MMNRMFGLFKGKQPEKEISPPPLDDIFVEGMEERTHKKDSAESSLTLTDFADVRSNYYGVSANGFLSLKPLGYHLTQQHYQQQLHTNMTFFMGHETFLQEAPALLKSFKKEDKNYRHGIIVINDEKHTNHSIPYIYIKENGDEALLIADSLGVENTAAAKIHDLTALDLLCVKTQRQASDFGCDVDAIILVRDCTTYLENNQYYIPDLLSRLKSRSILFMTIDESNLYSTKIPDKLLTTAEISYFVVVNREATPDKVYDFASIDKFHEAYYAYDPALKKTVNKFVEKTGWLIVDTIEIQFYLNQLQDQLGDKFTPESRTNFIKSASHILQAYGHVNEFLDKKIQKNRLGEDEFVIFRPSLHSHIPELLKQCLLENNHKHENTRNFIGR
jgi:hypothetical protein